METAGDDPFQAWHPSIRAVAQTTRGLAADGREVKVRSVRDIGVGETVATTAPTASGRALLAAAETATAWLATHRDAINALNVFPVPDGDTGTNMLLTMRGAVDAGRLALAASGDAGKVAASTARGALLAARGNSGVILSQVIQGFATAIAGRTEIDGRDLARGLSSARDLAYRAVLEPVEGTMLTVVRVAAEQATAAAAQSASLPVVLAAALQGARDALATTPRLLEILRQAGVVDAGGQGIVHLLEGLDRYARGEVSVNGDRVPPPVATAGSAMDFLDHLTEPHGDAAGYCTNFVVHGAGIDVDRARAALAALGESAVVVGDASLLKVHLHTLNPGRVLDYAAGLGELDQIKIDNMQLQTRTLAAERASHVVSRGGAPAAPNRLLPAPVGTLSVVAVAAGEGLAAALRSMGAAGLVTGGQTMNPSIEELLAAVESAPTAEVILLPNNRNILLTANQVPALATKHTAVVPSHSVPQGLAALAAFNPDDALDANVRRMTAALDGVRTVEVTRAVRDATIDGVRATRGQVIALVDDRMVAAGDEAVTVAGAALTRAGLDQAELVTIFVGEGATRDHAEELQALLVANRPRLTVEIHDGNQPHYLYVIAVE